MPRRKSIDNGLLSFDEDSPLFVKRKNSVKRKRVTKKRVTKKRVAPVVEDLIIIEDEPKPKRNRRKRKIVANPNIPKYSIKSPDDCKHILPAFKKLLKEKWEILQNGTYIETEFVASWIRGVSNYIKITRPKEHYELRLLAQIAKGISEDKNNKVKYNG